MKKNQIIGIILTVIFIFGGIIGWALWEKTKIPPSQEKIFSEEIFNLSGTVLSVDTESNYLMVKPMGQENEVKVIISDTTKLIKLEAPFDPQNPPPPGTQFTPLEKEITLADFKEGDEILIKTLKNIAGKNEFDDVEFITILP